MPQQKKVRPNLRQICIRVLHHQTYNNNYLLSSSFFMLLLWKDTAPSDFSLLLLLLHLIHLSPSLSWRMRRRCGGGAHTDLIMMFVNNYASLWDFLLACLTWDCLRRWPQGDEARAPRRGSWINYHYSPLSSDVCKLTVNGIWQHWIRWSSLMSPWQI